MLVSIEQGFVFIAAGKTATTSLTAAVLPHCTADRARLPFAIRLDAPARPALEAIVNDEGRPITDPKTFQALVQLYAAEDPFEIVFSNRESGYERRSTDLNDLRHVPLRDARRLIGDAVWARLFKFAFVRDPWDWVRSNYLFKRRPERFERMDVESVEWVRDNVSRRQLPVGYRTQHAFLADDDETIALDFVGRFERLERDFAAIADRLGFDAKLDRLNSTGAAKVVDSRAGYTDAGARRVAELWATDIAAFGYGG